MIHTKELRFGNKVQTRQGEIITIQQILSNAIVCETQIEVNSEALELSGASAEGEYLFELNEVVRELDIDEIYPIALTPEILKQCGFRNFVREEWIISIGNSHIDFVYTDNILRLRCPAPSLSNIKHLHQLQNLLFAITSQELEIELEKP
jgi:hypothetical protein